MWRFLPLRHCLGGNGSRILAGAGARFASSIGRGGGPRMYTAWSRGQCRRRHSTSPLTTSEDARFALTHLPNGIRVAGLNTPGPCIAAGVLVELPDNQRLPPHPGTTASSFIMEKLAFKVRRLLSLGARPRGRGDAPSRLRPI